MITFNLQSGNGNYYCGHEPSNDHGNCWSDRKHALVFTLEQARVISKAWGHYLNIIVSVESEPMTDAEFKHELFCAKGGSWFAYVAGRRMCKACHIRPIAIDDDGECVDCRH